MAQNKGGGAAMRLVLLVAGVVGAYFIIRQLGTGAGTDWVDRLVRDQGLPGEAIFVALGLAATAAGVPRQAVGFLAGYAFGAQTGILLAMLAQSRVRTDYPMKVDNFDFKVADLVEHEKHTCQPRTELTFKLIALVHYLKSDDKWKSAAGEDWDIPRLIKEELAQPIIGAACGGTHRLTGFSYAVHKRQQRKEPLDGQWERARKFIEEYHAYTFKLQNPDGSYSTNWFAGREDNGPPSRRLETTGHITEWLAYSLNEEELQDPRMVKSVDYLANLLLDGRNEKWAIGPLGHGLHALAIYDERVFGGKPGQRSDELARQVKPLVRRK